MEEFACKQGTLLVIIVCISSSPKRRFSNANFVGDLGQRRSASDGHFRDGSENTRIIAPDQLNAPDLARKDL